MATIPGRLRLKVGLGDALTMPMDADIGDRVQAPNCKWGRPIGSTENR